MISVLWVKKLSEEKRTGEAYLRMANDIPTIVSFERRGLRWPAPLLDSSRESRLVFSVGSFMMVIYHALTGGNLGNR